MPRKPHIPVLVGIGGLPGCPVPEPVGRCSVCRRPAHPVWDTVLDHKRRKFCSGDCLVRLLWERMEKLNNSDRATV